MNEFLTMAIHWFFTVSLLVTGQHISMPLLNIMIYSKRTMKCTEMLSKVLRWYFPLFCKKFHLVFCQNRPIHFDGVKCNQRTIKSRRIENKLWNHMKCQWYTVSTLHTMFGCDLIVPPAYHVQRVRLMSLMNHFNDIFACKCMNMVI